MIISKFPQGKHYKIYGVRINETVSNSKNAVEYTDDAAGLQPGALDWCTIYGIRPCLFKNGVVQYYLNPANYAQKADGTAATINSTTAGDVMVEIPKIAYMMYRDGNYLYLKITDNPHAKSVDSRFCYYAHTRTTEGDRDYLYIGAYLGYLSGTGSSSKLYSLSNKTPNGTGNNMTSYINAANHKGTGYDILGFYPLTLLQILSVIRYKTINPAVYLGDWYNNDTNNTGTGNTAGMYTDATTAEMKFLGLERLYGGFMQYIGGAVINNSYTIKTAFTGFTSELNNGISRGACNFSSETEGFLKKPEGTNEKGFIPKVLGASNSTYYANKIKMWNVKECTFGANFGISGMFTLDFSHFSGTTSRYNVARLMYL